MIHFERLIKLLQLQPGTYLVKAKEGLDGSGRHSVYNQQGLGSIESHNMIIWMWVPLELVIDSSDVATGNQPSTSTCSSGRNSVCLWRKAPQAVQRLGDQSF